MVTLGKSLPILFSFSIDQLSVSKVLGLVNGGKYISSCGVGLKFSHHVVGYPITFEPLSYQQAPLARQAAVVAHGVQTWVGFMMIVFLFK